MTEKLLIAIYSHPEAYPPTLNALTELSGIYKHISVLFRPTMSLAWEYPANISLHAIGKAMSSREQESLPLLSRIQLFLNFSFELTKFCKKEQPDLVLLYDPLALLAYRTALLLGLKKQRIWYHNHDVLEKGMKKYSLNWWAAQAEKKIFPEINIFSLPSEERKVYFPMKGFSGKYFFIPNQPAISFYRQFQNIKKDRSRWRVIFQGYIDKGHGIEEVLNLMPIEIGGRPIHLILAGWVKGGYKEVLQGIIKSRGLKENVEFVGYVPYHKLPKLTASCHIGIAIHTQDNMNFNTLGTASNKIYEYAAVGLPVLYFDNEHFNSHLGRFDWAIPTDVSRQSLLQALENIAGNYERLSETAQRDFEEDLNFEKHFEQVNVFLKKQKD